MGQILSLYVTKSLGQSLDQIFCFIEGQFLAQIKYRIFEQIGCVDAALGLEIVQLLSAANRPPAPVVGSAFSVINVI